MNNNTVNIKLALVKLLKNSKAKNNIIYKCVVESLLDYVNTGHKISDLECFCLCKGYTGKPYIFY